MWLHLQSLSRMTYRQVFQHPHPFSIPFVLVEMVLAEQHLPHSVEVGLWRERYNIWLASFEHPSASLSLS